MALLQASGPAEGVVGVAGGAAGTGLGAEGGAERFPAGTDATGGGTQHPEGNQPEPGLEQRSPHQPVPGINQMHTYTHTHRNASTHLQLHEGALCLRCQSTIYMQKRDLVLHSGDTQVYYPLDKKKYLKH